MTSLSQIGLGTYGSFLAGMMTFVGALPLIAWRRISDKTMDGLLGLSAGIMLAATAFSLLIPAIALSGAGIMGASKTSMGVILGGLVLYCSNQLIPHEHFQIGPEGPSSSLRRIWLFVFAITLHNFPEGLAVGVSFAENNPISGWKMATAIGLQNIPEGLAIGLALLREKYKLNFVLAIVLLSGLVEPVGGFLGISIVTYARILLPWGLSFAAGAMLWVISHEIIPETHRKGFENIATAGLLLGFCLMMILDNL